MQKHFRLPSNTAEGHGQLAQENPGLTEFDADLIWATGGQEWALWVQFVTAEGEAVQLTSAQIKALARSRGARA